MVNVEIKSKWIRSNFKSEAYNFTEITVVTVNNLRQFIKQNLNYLSIN